MSFEMLLVTRLIQMYTNTIHRYRENWAYRDTLYIDCG